MIGKTIGEGTFGKVKLAVHIPTGEKVCLHLSLSFVYTAVVTGKCVVRILGGYQNIGKEPY
jgi:serine/threonine protein kinase